MPFYLINYLCPECLALLKLTGFLAVNEVGRKNCEGCGGNEDNLTVVDGPKCEAAIKKYNAEIDNEN